MRISGPAQSRRTSNAISPRPFGSIDWTITKEFGGGLHSFRNGLCFFRNVTGMITLWRLGIAAKLALGGMIYRAGPDEYRDVMAFCGPGNAGMKLSREVSWDITSSSVATILLISVPAIGNRMLARFRNIQSKMLSSARSNGMFCRRISFGWNVATSCPNRLGHRNWGG
jgi:hypothetical protein